MDQIIEARRHTLSRLTREETTNAGLWLDKFLPQQTPRDKTASAEKKNFNSELINQVAGIAEPEVYTEFFARWKTLLERLGAKSQMAEVAGRMIVGLGDESVIETAVTLHHTYGVPYIPGSALKGLAAHFAHSYLGDEWKKGSPAYNVVFGETDNAGYIIFLDGLYLPKSGKDGRPLHVDIMTVHHEDYYSEKLSSTSDALSSPADWDDPNPIPFLSATGKYLIALTAPKGCEEWIERAFEIVQLALCTVGVGAKTSSGYGRLKFPAKPLDLDAQKADRLIQEIELLPLSKVAGEINQLIDRWRKLEVNSVQKRRVAAAILEKNRQAGREKATKEKNWYKELCACLADNT